MQYAESMLLCGELINANDAEYDTYKDLLCRCPNCGSEVFLKKSYTRQYKNNKSTSVRASWNHFQEVPAIVEARCESRTKYGKKKILTQNSQARNQRLKLYRYRLWDLIHKSPILNDTKENLQYEYIWGSDLIRYFAEELLLTCRSKEIQEQIPGEVSNLYEGFLAQTWTVEKESDYKLLQSILANDKHKIYRKQVAGEALGFVMKHWSTNDMKKLVCLGFNDELEENIKIFSSLNKEITFRVLGKDNQQSFLSLWERDKFLGMQSCETIARKFPHYRENFVKGMAGIKVGFFVNLCLIFLSIPWIDELRKINQQSKSRKVC